MTQKHERHFRCPDCGPHVRVDEDGCCSLCGCDCTVESCTCHYHKDGSACPDGKCGRAHLPQPECVCSDPSCATAYAHTHSPTTGQPMQLFVPCEDGLVHMSSAAGHTGSNAVGTGAFDSLPVCPDPQAVAIERTAVLLQQLHDLGDAWCEEADTISSPVASIGAAVQRSCAKQLRRLVASLSDASTTTPTQRAIRNLRAVLLQRGTYPGASEFDLGVRHGIEIALSELDSQSTPSRG